MNEKIVTIAAAPEEPGLCHRAVRQEPPRRPQPHAADQSRLRRVLRQPLSPQRRGRAGDVRLSIRRRTFPNFKKTFGPRGVIHSWATDKDDPTEDAALGQGRQAEDRGHRPAEQRSGWRPATTSSSPPPRISSSAQNEGRQAVLRLAQHHPHAPVHAHQEGEPGPGGPLAVALSRHDDRPRQERRRRCSTTSTSSASPTTPSCMYSTDNGPHRNTWPDGGMTPFRSEKNTNWEGAFRVPLLVRWPGKIKAGSVANGIVQHHDWLPTFLAMAGDAGHRREAEEGLQGDRPHLQEPHRWLQPAALSDRRGEEESAQALLLHQRRRRHPRRCATTTGRSCSWSSAARAPCRSGRSPSCGCGCRRSSTCAPTLTSSPTSPRTPTTTGSCYHAYIIYGAMTVVGEVRGNLQGLPADPEAEHLHDRRCDQDDGRHGRRRRALSSNDPTGGEQRLAARNRYTAGAMRVRPRIRAHEQRLENSP